MAEMEKGYLSGKGKTKFTTSVAAAVFRYKGYPTNDEYEHLGKQMVAKCPFLKSQNGSGYVSNTYVSTMDYTSVFCVPFDSCTELYTIYQYCFHKINDFESKVYASMVSLIIGTVTYYCAHLYRYILDNGLVCLLMRCAL